MTRKDFLGVILRRMILQERRVKSKKIYARQLFVIWQVKISVKMLMLLMMMMRMRYSWVVQRVRVNVVKIYPLKSDCKVKIYCEKKKLQVLKRSPR